MDGIQGAVLQVKLKHLEKANELRRAHAGRYAALLGAVDGVSIPAEASARRHVYHLYAVRVQKRDAILQALAGIGIHCGIHYPIPVHLQEAYRSLGLTQGSFPVAERCASEFLSLPMFPELTDDQIHVVCRELVNCIGGAGSLAN
jgi:dTDP-4-amino-4,6-dideoxygalactose transaminase